MATRQGNNPKRRVAAADFLDQRGREALATRVRYTGSAIHKRYPGNYGFHPPTNPRPWKSLCDDRRVVLLEEAAELLQQGVMAGMFSSFADGDLPKYVWSVDADRAVYEGKLDRNGYHGYRLADDDDFGRLVLKEWDVRCPRR